jgi:cytoskeletal protein RodZ
MSKRKGNTAGFAVAETVLVLAIIAIIGFVVWFVVRAKHNTDKNLNTANSSQTTSGKTSGSDDQNLQNDLSGINSANNQTTKDLNTTNTGLNDNSTFTSLP